MSWRSRGETPFLKRFFFESYRYQPTCQAERLGVNLKSVTVSKKKTWPSPFGIANAFNTGFLLSKGDVCTILQDNIYLPPNFVEQTLAFYEEQPTSILSYAETRWDAPKGVFQPERLHDKSALSLFEPRVTESPRDLGWRYTYIGGTMPHEVWENMQQGGVKRVNWYNRNSPLHPSKNRKNLFGAQAGMLLLLDPLECVGNVEWGGRDAGHWGRLSRTQS